MYHDKLSIQVEADVQYLVKEKCQIPSDNIHEGMHSLYKSEALVDTTKEVSRQGV